MKCFSEISIKRPGGSGPSDRLNVPCGKCPACLQNRRNEWSFRLNEESKVSSSAFFITLTYNDDNVPGELSKRDLNLFLKRLRAYSVKSDTKLLKDKKNVLNRLEMTSTIKYYAIGEYGELNNRPHYHIIIFNLPLDIELEKIWKKGFIKVGNVESASIHYVTGYVMKRYDNYREKQVPFAVMSKGLGASYLSRAYDWHKSEGRFYVINEFGSKQRIPRCYKNKIFNVVEKIYNANRNMRLYDEKMEKGEETVKDFYKNMMEEKELRRRLVNEKIKLKKL